MCARLLFRVLRGGFLVALLLLTPSSSRAQWQLDGTPLCTVADGQGLLPKIVSDGAGGAIVTWMDTRGANGDIYAQRVDAWGVVQWTTDGVALCTATDLQRFHSTVSDGAGGAVVTWIDERSGTNYDIYAQRVDASGAVQWTADGVALCTAGHAPQNSPAVASDGAGGAIVAWYDYRSGTNYDIYAQRVDAAGTVQWATDGVALCTAANDQLYPAIVLDGAGGAIVTWEDRRSGQYVDDIYAQRVDAAGAVQWASDGVALCTAADMQMGPAIVSDGAGGAIVTWPDWRSGVFEDIYAQRVDAAGAVQWASDGVALCTAADQQEFPMIASDGAGGAIVTWRDYRSGTNSDIYVQRVDASGAVQWVANGVALCTAADDQIASTIASDGAGGAILTWMDFRSGGGLLSSADIYAQRVDASGAVQWAYNGVALCTAADGQADPTIVSDGAGGAIVTWEDYRSGTNYDIYAQRVDATYGYWGHPEPIVMSVSDVPNDQGGKVAVNWKASGRDIPIPATIDFYTIWRAVDAAPASAVGSSASGPAALASLENVDTDTPVGSMMATSEPPYYWELVGKQTAYRWAYYSFVAPTRADSVAADPGTEFFMVAAHDLSDEHIAFASNAVSGHSVDNLAPAAPMMLTAQRVGPDVQLEWRRVRVRDLKHYAVYRATSSGVTPVPGNFLSSSTDSVLVDRGVPGSELHYVITAKDVHENQSAPSNEASVSAVTGVGGTPVLITRLTVLQNIPNPFTGATDLLVGLPAPSDVSIEVYDVAGRRVGEIEVKGAAAGWQRVPFAGRDPRGQSLASGVYFYRVTANGSTVTRKMVITR